MANDLGQLVLAGTKTATCALLWEYQAEGEPLPELDGLCIIVDGRDRPLCIIETTDVTILPFSAVGDEHAAAEGEGDGSLAHWREAHRAFFVRRCAVLNRDFTPEAPLVCERFRLVWPVAAL